MSTASRYARLAADFAATVAAVPDDRWDAPSPCDGWSTRDVLDHVVAAHETFLGRIDRVPADRPSTVDDPDGAFDAVRRAVEGALADPAVSSVTWSSEIGEHAFAETIDDYQCLDLLVHRWDLARGAGLEVTLPEDELRRVHERVSSWPEQMVRGDNVFGPALDVPEGADTQTRVLAFLGRDPTA